MKDLLKTVSINALIITACLVTAPQAKAEENGPLVAELITRVGSVEAENRELRGLLDENRHEIANLKQRMETLSSDVDHRMSSSEHNANPPTSAGTHHSEGQPIPLGKSMGAETSHPINNSENKPTINSATDYEAARTLLEQGEYEAAEKAFAGFVSSHSKDEQAGAAQYWLGVTFFVRGQHEKAAKAFAKGYKTYPKSSKSPDNLLKLSKSLAALDRTADACSALDQLSSEHPKSLVKEVNYERKNLGCK